MREAAVKGREVIDAVESVTKGRSVSLGVTKAIRHSISFITLSCFGDMGCSTVGWRQPWKLCEFQ